MQPSAQPLAAALLLVCLCTPAAAFSFRQLLQSDTSNGYNPWKADVLQQRGAVRAANGMKPRDIVYLPMSGSAATMKIYATYDSAAGAFTKIRANGDYQFCTGVEGDTQCAASAACTGSFATDSPCTAYGGLGLCGVSVRGARRTGVTLAGGFSIRLDMHANAVGTCSHRRAAARRLMEASPSPSPGNNVDNTPEDDMEPDQTVNYDGSDPTELAPTDYSDDADGNATDTTVTPTVPTTTTAPPVMPTVVPTQPNTTIDNPIMTPGQPIPTTDKPVVMPSMMPGQPIPSNTPLVVSSPPNTTTTPPTTTTNPHIIPIDNVPTTTTTTPPTTTTTPPATTTTTPPVTPTGNVPISTTNPPISTTDPPTTTTTPPTTTIPPITPTNNVPITPIDNVQPTPIDTSNGPDSTDTQQYDYSYDYSPLVTDDNTSDGQDVTDTNTAGGGGGNSGGRGKSKLSYYGGACEVALLFQNGASSTCACFNGVTTAHVGRTAPRMASGNGGGQRGAVYKRWKCMNLVPTTGAACTCEA